jgi:hypothetical protein
LKGVDGVCLPRLSADIEKQRPDRALNSLRQRDPIENFADEKVSLNRGQVFSYDLVIEPQTKQASRVAWGFKLNDNPLDRHFVSAALYLLISPRLDGGPIFARARAVDRTRNMARYLVACLAYYVRIGILRKQEQPT